MSLFGATMILCACLLTAHRFLERKRRELRTLRDLDLAMERLYAELSLRLTSLPELAGILAREGQGDAAVLFERLGFLLAKLGERPFSELWQEALKSVPDLNAEDLSTLQRLGASLGRYALEEQLSAVSCCREKLRASAEARAAGMNGAVRTACGLAVAAAALLSILLY